MNADASDWLSLDETVTHVEATLKCYRELAKCLVRQAVYGFKLKSRTSHCPSEPRWVVLERAGQEIICSDKGERIEFCRKDVLNLWPEHPKDATQSTPLKARPAPITDGIVMVIIDLWGGQIPPGLLAKDRNNQIREELERKKMSVSANLERAVQRALRSMREKQQS